MNLQLYERLVVRAARRRHLSVTARDIRGIASDPPPLPTTAPLSTDHSNDRP